MKHRDRPMTHNAFYAILIAMVLWMSYLACTDEAGSLDVPGSADLAMWRIGQGFKAVAGEAETSIEETNQDMQDVATGRRELNDSRVERDIEGE